MKYGIKATYKDGSFEYACSTRGSAAFSSKIDDIALFVQEKTAVSALKQLWKRGFERINHCVLEVVGVEMAEVANIIVPRPAQKTGLVLTAPRTNYRGEVEVVFFSGPKKAGGNIAWTQVVEAATLFDSEDQAMTRLNDSLNASKLRLAQNIHQSTNGPVPWRETDRERESRERMQQQAVDYSMKEVEWHDTVQVQEVTI